MAFAIPDWDDDKSSNTVQRKISKPKEEIHNKLLKTKLNGVADKSKLIKKKSIKKENDKVKHSNLNTMKTKSKEIHAAPLIKKILPKEKNNLKIKSKQFLEKPKRKRHETLQKDSSRFKVESIVTDEIDEVLLNAKKNKFNEALKKDDVEQDLFAEDESLKVKKTLNLPKNKQQKKKIISKSKELKAKLNISKVLLSKNIKNTKTQTLKKVGSKPTEIEESDDEETYKTPIKKTDKKKEKLKLILQQNSNRNPINFNRNKLRERMLDRLKSAQFRFINEKLYTSSGTEASELFQNDPAAFQSYHEGYQQQVKKWPVNPLDVIIKRIKKMPKTHQIADMGCGEAELSRRVSQPVRSFDLQAARPHVEVCDMSHTPLLAESMDAVVYCLALMGTELTAYLLEANRVLKTGGHLLIAEVESRFSDVDAFTKDVTRLGFKLVKINKDHEVFFFFEFVKNQGAPVKKSKLPALTLKPCIYKRR